MFKIQLGPLGGRSFLYDQLVTETGSAADGPTRFRKQLQPPSGTSQKGRRCQQVASACDIDGHQDTTDQAHVVIGRQPGHALWWVIGLIFQRDFKTDADRFQIAQQAAVSDHHSARLRGGTGSVLQKRQIVWLALDRLKAAGRGINFVGCFPRNRCQGRRLLLQAQPAQHRAMGEHQPRSAVGHNRV